MSRRIFESFPSKEYAVADIYSVIAYYLTHKDKIEKYLASREKEADLIRKKIESLPGYKEKQEQLRKKSVTVWKIINNLRFDFLE